MRCHIRKPGELKQILNKMLLESPTKTKAQFISEMAAKLGVSEEKIKEIMDA